MYVNARGVGVDISQLSVKRVLDEIEITNEPQGLSMRERHLIGLAVTLTRGCQACTRRRMAAAVSEGIPQQALSNLVNLVAAVNAGVVLRTALESVGELTSDISADASCADGSCTAL